MSPLTPEEKAGHMAPVQAPGLDALKAMQDKAHPSMSSTALKTLGNFAGGSMALAAAQTRAMFDKVQPQWKAEPVAKDPKPEPPIEPRAVRPIGEIAQRVSDGGTNAAAAATHRLQLVNASASEVAKYRVRLGKCGGYLADGGMTDFSDDPIFVQAFTGTGTRVVYAKMPMNYSGEGQWDVSGDGTVLDGASLPDNDDDFFYVEIGSATVAGGNAAIVTPQPVRGDIAIVRIGNSTVYVDRNENIP